MRNWRTKIHTTAGNLGIWWVIFGPGGIAVTVGGVALWFFEPVAHHGWAAVVLAALLLGILTIAVASLALIAWRYCFSTFLTTPNVEHRNDEGKKNIQSTYEGGHRELMLFVVNHLLWTCADQITLQMQIITKICPNTEVRGLACSGAMCDSKVSKFANAYNKLVVLGGSPPGYIPLDQMIEAVRAIETSFYDFQLRAKRLAKSAGIDIARDPDFADTLEELASHYDAMVVAYEPIKKNDKLGKLFRPVRQSEWGGVIRRVRDDVESSNDG